MIIQSAKVSEFYKYEDYYPKWILWIAKKLNISIDRNTEYAFQATVTVSKEDYEAFMPHSGYVISIGGHEMYCILSYNETLFLWTTKSTKKVLTAEDFVGKLAICLYQAKEELPKISVIKEIISSIYSLFFFKKQTYIPRYVQILLGISAWFNLGLLIIRSL